MPESPATVAIWELMSADISPEDLDFELDEDAVNTMNEFEIAWRNFMRDHPELVPQGTREQRIKQLQKEVQELDKTREEANEELHKQLDFFEKSNADMEESNKKQLEEVRAKQIKTHDKLQKQLESISIAEHLLSEAYPWEHFLAAVDDKASEMTSTNDSRSESEHSKKAKPSNRALYLVDDTAGDPRDIEFRAYRIDHALLDTQVKMLQKEAEGYEKLLETQAPLRRLLSEYGIIKPMTPKSSKANSRSTSAE